MKRFITKFKQFESLNISNFIYCILNHDYTCIENNIKKDKYLVDFNWNSSTLLTYSIKKKDKKLFDLLLKYNVDVNMEAQHTITYLKNINDLYYIMELYKRNFDVNTKYDGEPFIILVLKSKNIKLFSYLIQNTKLNLLETNDYHNDIMYYSLRKSVKHTIDILLNGYPMQLFINKHKKLKTHILPEGIMKQEILKKIKEYPKLNDEYDSLITIENFNI